MQRLLFGPGARRTLAGLAIAAVGTAVITVVGLRSDVGPGVIRPGIALLILAATLVGGLWPALVASGGGFLAYVTLFVRPQGQAGLGAPEVFVLVAFLAVAIVVSWLEAATASARAGRHRLAFLAEANSLLSSSLDFSRTIGEVARLAVPTLADWCAIQTFAPGRGELELEVAHSDPAKVEEVRELTRRYPPDPADRAQALAEVLTSGETVYLPRVPESLLESVARDQEHLRRIRALGIRSAIIVPLQARRRIFGALTMAFAESNRRYRASDVPFAEQLARSAATALDNARLYQETMEVARILQQSLLPVDLPEIPGVEVAARYRAGEEGTLVGGDFYDVFDAGGGAWAVAVGDVCGKGPEAAALTGLVRHTIRTAAVRDGLPSAVLDLVNRQIIRHGGDRFCTVTLGRVEPRNGGVALTVSCGGHPPPLVYRPSGSVEAADCLGTVLGVFPDPDLVDSPISLGPGDSIVFYTDGVTERFERAGADGGARLVALLWEGPGLDAAEIADRIYRDAALAGGRPRDDMAIVVLRVAGP